MSTQDSPAVVYLAYGEVTWTKDRHVLPVLKEIATKELEKGNTTPMWKVNGVTIRTFKDSPIGSTRSSTAGRHAKHRLFLKPVGKTARHLGQK